MARGIGPRIDTERGQEETTREWDGQTTEKTERGQTEGEGGKVRRGYTPEPVYGQKCESPRLTKVSGQGIV